MKSNSLSSTCVMFLIFAHINLSSLAAGGVVPKKACVNLSVAALSPLKSAKPWALELLAKDVGSGWTLRSSLFGPNKYFALIYGYRMSGNKEEAMSSLKNRLDRAGWISCGRDRARGVLSQKLFHGYPIVARIVEHQTFPSFDGTVDLIQVELSPSNYTDDGD